MKKYRIMPNSLPHQYNCTAILNVRMFEGSVQRYVAIRVHRLLHGSDFRKILANAWFALYHSIRMDPVYHRVGVLVCRRKPIGLDVAVSAQHT